VDLKQAEYHASFLGSIKWASLQLIGFWQHLSSRRHFLQANILGGTHRSVGGYEAYSAVNGFDGIELGLWRPWF
jgi:hypothetical protein